MNTRRFNKFECNHKQVTPWIALRSLIKLTHFRASTPPYHLEVNPIANHMFNTPRKIKMLENSRRAIFGTL